MSNNGETPNSFAVTVDEFEGVCQEISDSMTEMKNVINIHAEALQLHRYIFEKFFPKPQLEAAAAEYYQKRTAEIQSAEPDAKAN